MVAAVTFYHFKSLFVKADGEGYSESEPGNTSPHRFV